MKNIVRMVCAAALIGVIVLGAGPSLAVDLSFQPRMEVGVMYYSFESEAINEIHGSMPVALNSGFGITQEAFEFSDRLPFVGAGATFFLNRFFLDLSGQFAAGGQDAAPIVYSAYGIDSYDFENMYVNTGFMATESTHTARFNRSEAAVALGYAFTRRFGMFAGYKWAGTQFKTTFQGRYSTFGYYSDSDLDGPGAGRMWGEADYRFKYQGPFAGAVQSWDCSGRRFLKGVFTANLALACLSGKLTLDRLDQYLSVVSVNGQPVPAVVRHVDGGLFARFDTKGGAWGLTFGAGWHGETALEGLSYFINTSGYRYEFDARENSQSDINETAVIFKMGLSYIF